MKRGWSSNGEGMEEEKKGIDMHSTLGPLQLFSRGCACGSQGPDLENILRQSYDYHTIMPKLRSTYDKRLMYKTSFLGYNSLAES